jgi:hypothetical protein
VAMRADFVVAAVVINDHAGDIIYAITKRISTQDAAVDINIILSIQNSSLFLDLNFNI